MYGGEGGSRGLHYYELTDGDDSGTGAIRGVIRGVSGYPEIVDTERQTGGEGYVRADGPPTSVRRRAGTLLNNSPDRIRGSRLRRIKESGRGRRLVYQGRSPKDPI